MRMGRVRRCGDGYVNLCESSKATRWLVTYPFLTSESRSCVIGVASACLEIFGSR
jgi:hypothetical protein